MMNLLLWSLLGGPSAAADPVDDPPLLAGPAVHGWSTHLRLWSTVGDDARPLSIGHEIRFDDRQLSRVKRQESGVRVWRPGDEETKRTFYLEDSDTTLTVEADGAWRTSLGDEGTGCAFAAGSDQRLLLIADGKLWMWVNRLAGISTVSGPIFETASDRVDITGLIDDLSAFKLYHYEEVLGSGTADKLIAIPMQDGELDRSRVGYAFFSFSPSRGNVRLIGARLRLSGPAAAGPDNVRQNGAFTRVPVVSVGRWSRWWVQLEGAASAQVGGLVELDRDPPPALGGARLRGRNGYVYGSIEGHNGGAIGLVGLTAPSGWYGGAQLGSFEKVAVGGIAGGFDAAVGRGQAWVLDLGVGIGSATSGHAQVGRVIRTGRPWDLVVSPRVSFIDVDWYQDANIRFPIYAGVNLGTRRSGIRLSGR